MSHQPIIKDSDIIDGLSVRYLKLYGLWKVINDYRETGKKNVIIKFHLLATLVLALPSIISQMISYFVIDIDIQKVTILNFNTIPALQMCCRLLTFWFCMERQCRLYSLLRKDFLELPLKNLADKENVLKKISKTSNFCCTMSLIVNFSIVALYIIYPGVSVDYILYHTGNMADVKTGKNKILGCWYPIPMGESPYYEMMFIFEAIVLTWGGFLLQGYFCLFYQVLMCLSAQFAVLGQHISSLEPVRSRKNMQNNFPVYTELHKIVKEHQKLLRYTDDLRSVYNPLVTMTLGMGVLILIIGVSQFLFAKTGDPVYIFRFIQLLAYQGIEVSTICFGSSALETASSDLHFAIYNSDWYKADAKFRKMAMLRAEKGVTLTAIRMYPVNVETLMAILQFTYSVSTVMSRMTE